MYELLSENDVLQGGDVVVCDDGDEMIIIAGGGWDGCKIFALIGWHGDVVAVLRPPTTH